MPVASLDVTLVIVEHQGTGDVELANQSVHAPQRISVERMQELLEELSVNALMEYEENIG